MTSQIDHTVFVDGQKVAKQDLRNQFEIAANEITALQLALSFATGGEGGGDLSANLANLKIGVVRNGMTGQEIADVISNTNYNSIIVPEPLGTDDDPITDTIDISDVTGKTLISLVSGKPVIKSTASVCLKVGGQSMIDFKLKEHAPRFLGEWWFDGVGDTGDNTYQTCQCIEVVPETYELGFDKVWMMGWNIGIQGLAGNIRGVTINYLSMYNIRSKGVEFYSPQSFAEIDSIKILEVHSNNSESDSGVVWFSFGPNCGSGGKQGLQIGGGILYRGTHGLHFWGVLEVESGVWSAADGGTITVTLTHRHNVKVGDTFLLGECDTNWNGSYQAIAGTGDKTLVAVKASDPGALVTLGYYAIGADSTPAGQIMNDISRKNRIMNLSFRGPVQDAVVCAGAADTELVGCTFDDPGISDFNNPVTAASWDSGSGGIVTFVLQNPHTLSPGDLFVTQLNRPVGYNDTFTVATAPDGVTVTAAMPNNPRGTSALTDTLGSDASDQLGNFDVPLTFASGVHVQKRCQGRILIHRGMFHECYRAAVLVESYSVLQVIVRDSHIWNSSWGAPGVHPGIEVLPGIGNIIVVGCTIGNADHWQRASRSFSFSGQPTAGHAVEMGPTATKTTVTFRASNPGFCEVLIGATLADTLANFAELINTTPIPNFARIRAWVIGDTLFMLHYPGNIGLEYNLAAVPTTSGGGVISIVPSGTRLGGGTGTRTQSYAIKGIVDGVNGCVMRDNTYENNIDGEVYPDPKDIIVNTWTSGTFSFPGYENVRQYEVYCWSGGGGGGSGRRGAAGSARGGGLGGAAGLMAYARFAPEQLTFPVTGTVGAGGAGGAAQTVNDTDGVAGSAGGDTTFGAYLKAYGGPGGIAGSNAAINFLTGATAAVQTGPYLFAANGSVTTFVTQTSTNTNSNRGHGGGPGGTGGSLTTGNVAMAGSQAHFEGWMDPALSAPTGPATSGNAGAAGVASTLHFVAGYGGGGGGANGGNGGGAPAGSASGGGGGGASLNGTNSGKGGDGGSGKIVIVSHIRR